MSLKDIKPYKGKRKALLLTLADPENIGLDVLAICEKAGISRESYYKYTKEPDFQAALKELSINIYVRHLPQSVNSVVKMAKKGDMGANRLMHESTGMVSKGGNQTVNIANVDGQQQETQEFESDADALAYVERVRAELDQIEQAVRARAGNRLPDGIQPEPDDAGTEEA